MLLARLAEAGMLPCPRCGRPMLIGMRLDVGHEIDVAAGGGSSAMRLEHMSCNRKAGDRRRGRNRNLQAGSGGERSKAEDAEDRELVRRGKLNQRERRRRRIMLPGTTDK